jgi:hypothetical protein
MNLKGYAFKDACMYCEVDCESRSYDKDVWFVFSLSCEQSVNGKMSIQLMFDITSMEY